jgi:hypothetical protein
LISSSFERLPKKPITTGARIFTVDMNDYRVVGNPAGLRDWMHQTNWGQTFHFLMWNSPKNQ